MIGGGSDIEGVSNPLTPRVEAEDTLLERALVAEVVAQEHEGAPGNGVRLEVGRRQDPDGEIDGQFPASQKAGCCGVVSAPSAVAQACRIEGSAPRRHGDRPEVSAKYTWRR
jgi:hypothetical protein